eukprot:g13169.t1
MRRGTSTRASGPPSPRGGGVDPAGGLRRTLGECAAFLILAAADIGIGSSAANAKAEDLGAALNTSRTMCRTWSVDGSRFQRPRRSRFWVWVSTWTRPAPAGLLVAPASVGRSSGSPVLGCAATGALQVTAREKIRKGISGQGGPGLLHGMAPRGPLPVRGPLPRAHASDRRGPGPPRAVPRVRSMSRLAGARTTAIGLGCSQWDPEKSATMLLQETRAALAPWKSTSYPRRPAIYGRRLRQRPPLARQSRRKMRPGGDSYLAREDGRGTRDAYAIKPHRDQSKIFAILYDNSPAFSVLCYCGKKSVGDGPRADGVYGPAA